MKASGANLTKTNSNPCNMVPATAHSLKPQNYVWNVV